MLISLRGFLRKLALGARFFLRNLFILLFFFLFMQESLVKVGERYRHFKGELYEVLMIVLDSDTLKKVVVYKGFYNSEKFGKNPVWSRPLEDFIGFKEKDEKKIKRFQLVKD